MKRILIAAFALISAIAWAGSFEVSKGVVVIPERGNVETIVLLTENRQFSFIPPYSYTSSVKTNLSQITFVSPQGNIAISVQITTSSPGSLPEESVLRDRMSALYPGCKFVQASGVYFWQGSGRSVDVSRVLPSKSRLMTRVAFLPFDEGTVEVTLTSDEASFPKQRSFFAAILSSFKIEPRQRDIHLQAR